jgi:HK97 gp10 family phage protein
MLKIDLKLKGAPQLKAAFERLGASVQRKVLRKALDASSKIAVQAARENVPVDTGALKSSIISKVSIGSKKSQSKIIAPVKYAHFVELGVPKRGVEPQPFLRPAIYDNREAARGQFISGLEDAIREAGFKDFKTAQASAAKSARRRARIKKRLSAKVKKFYKGLSKRGKSVSKSARRSFNQAKRSANKSFKQAKKSFNRAYRKLKQ